MSVFQSDNHAIFVELPWKEEALTVLGHHTSKANVASSNASQSAAGALPSSLS